MKKTFILICLTLMAVTLNAQTLKTLTWGGQERQYLEYVPSTYSEEAPAPVMFMLHGLGDEATNFFEATRIQAFAEQKGWIVVCPQALDFNLQTPLGNYDFGTSWSAGITVTVQLDLYGMPFTFPVTVNDGVDDSGFLMATLETLETEYTVEPDSIFFAGFSLGACMCHRMAIEHGDRINAIAAVSGVVGNDMQNLTPSANVDVLEIFGTNDEMISYDNAEISLQSYGFYNIGLPAEATVEYWRAFNQCEPNPFIEDYPDIQNDGLTFVMHSYINGNSRVAFLKVNNGLHRWYTDSSNDIDYTEEIMKFFTNTIDVTDVAETTGETLTIYPNPAKDVIHLESSEEVRIYDLTGQMVMRGQENINISSLPNGLYFVKVGTTNQKLVIDR